MSSADRRPRTSARAPVMEVFASIQGEGLFAGEPQVFARLRGCPLRCRYCDTPGSWKPLEGGSARVVAAGGEVRREEGEATPFQLATWIARAEPGLPRTLSVTGGEPLLWADFLLELPTFLAGRRLHLETAGPWPGALERVLPAVDHVSLDLKLPGDLDPPVGEPETPEPNPTGPAAWTAVQRRNLALLAGRDACVKLVLTEDADRSGLEDLLDLVAEQAPRLPVFLQPASACGGEGAGRVADLQWMVERALERELVPRVVPQLHRVLALP